jgi:hypothetical protein
MRHSDRNNRSDGFNWVLALAGVTLLIIVSIAFALSRDTQTSPRSSAKSTIFAEQNQSPRVP